MKMKFTNLLPAFFFLLGLSLHAQSTRTPLDVAIDYVHQHAATWQLNERDLNDMVVNYQYQTEHNGVTHIYFMQRNAGIELYNGILNVNVIPNGKVLNAGCRFIPGLSEKVNANTPVLSPAQAIESAATKLGLYISEPLRQLQQISGQEYLFGKSNISHRDIPVKLKYQSMKDGSVRLAWDLAIDQVGGKDYWSMRIDALTGEMLNKISWTSHCEFLSDCFKRIDQDCREEWVSEIRAQEEMAPPPPPNPTPSYRVFPLPLEAPSFGAHQLVTDPSDPIASPFGWHDVNGTPGAEYTITRGNNVWAYTDKNNTDQSSGDEPTGGANLLFDYPFNPNNEPVNNEKAAVVNLFYMNNMMHDFSYHYGFNEPAGNFQQKNYNVFGQSGDPVHAQALDGLNTNNTNNANFSAPPDGSNGTMQMYVWVGGNGKLLHITAPAEVIGDYEVSTAEFGAQVTSTPISGEIVVANDGSGNATQACSPIINDVTGKIALIDRGQCEFGEKALNAEEHGAIAVIICNFEEGLVGMAAGAQGANVTIPTLMLTYSDCQNLRLYAGSGLQATLQLPDNSGPTLLDGDFDNGIMAHEYGHGISTRLTGGPLNSGCLTNAEQMGEGWSDFMALVTTVKAGDTGPTKRGVGTYVLREDTDGGGIRRFPYSTDMTINPHTYDDIILNGEIHAFGEIWTSMLWDLYWAMVDQYGYDPNLLTGTGGNNKAIQLVVDGFKLQPCNPGFVDGRDAILAADIVDFGGVNQCLIWDVFARRGLGWDASQGSSDDTSDGTQSFEPYPLCLEELKIKKSMTPLINPGDQITVNIRVINHKPISVTGVNVSDNIPDGTTFVTGSANITPNVAGNVVSFDLGTMAYLDTVNITYKLQSDPNKKSINSFYDGMENGYDKWEWEGLEGNNYWGIQDFIFHNGSNAWAVDEPITSSDQVLRFADFQNVSGTQPVLRFYQRYETEYGNDGGFLEYTTDDVHWFAFNDQIFKNPYRGPMAYSTFAIPGLHGYWGNSNGFIPTYIDLSSFAGQNIKIRWRFGTNTDTNSSSHLGWFVDDVSLMDMVNYDSEVCVTSDQGDNVCTQAPERGTIVEPGFAVSAHDVVANKLGVEVYPNPAGDLLNIEISSNHSSQASISILSTDGRQVMQTNTRLYGNVQNVPMNVNTLPSGVYFVKVSSDNDSVVKKIVKN